MVFKTVEHAYQAAKTYSIDDRMKIANADTPGQAKRLGRKANVRSDWESVKVGVMRGLLIQKFSDVNLRKKLLATGKQELIEGNEWGDLFWGVCKGNGKNILGKLLMEIRDNETISNS